MGMGPYPRIGTWQVIGCICEGEVKGASAQERGEGVRRVSDIDELL